VTTPEARLIAERSGNAVELGDGELVLQFPQQPRTRIPLPEQWDELLDLRHAFPGRARGDQREMLLAAIVQDAAPATPRREYDELREALALPATLPAQGEVQRKVLAEVLREHYWVTPEATGSGASRPFAFPFHTSLAANYTQRGRYKMFRSDILLFLCWDGQDIDPLPVERLCELISDTDGFTLLDHMLADAALAHAGPQAVDRVTAAELLSSDQASKVRQYLAGGALCQPAMDRFRQDLVAALEMALPRHDRVEAAILTLALHLALYYYEVSFLVGNGLDEVTRAAARIGAGSPERFAGKLRFRIGTAGDRPVRRADGCAEAWRELDDRYLISLTPTIISANLLHLAWRALDPGAPANADPAGLAAAMHADPSLAATIDSSAGALAILYAARADGYAGPAIAELAASPEPGVHLLRTAVHAHLRSQLHYRSRAVVNQLIKRSFGGSLIRKRGPVLFFELDEAFLFLLVKFVLTRSGEERLPLNQFLDGLTMYGLQPQDTAAEEELAAALERLGMLHRYSDAGEAAYVRHLL
jgi:hypothetical protein